MALIKIKQIDGLSTDLNALVGVDSTQSSDIADLGNDVSALESVDSTQSSAIAALEDVDSTQSSDIADLGNDVSALESVDSTQSSAIAALESVDSTQSSAIADLGNSVNSIESAFVKDPFEIETSTAPVAGADTIVTIGLTGSIEDGVNGNVVSVSVNGVVLPANSLLATSGEEGYNVTGVDEVDIRLGYALDANDEISIKYVRE